ncbi:MAG: hypothetical protein WDZ68_00405, partial [Candidatus Paceibacterota bacterium]
MTQVFRGIGLQNDNVRVSKSEIRFGPLSIRRVATLPPDSEGRIGDIVILDNSKGYFPENPIDRVPTLTGVFQKSSAGTWISIVADPATFVNETGDDMTGDLTFATSGSIGIGTLTPGYSIDITRTDAIGLPPGTTAQRPAPGREGLLRFNTETNTPEISIDGAWHSVSTFNDPGIDTTQQNLLVVSKDPGEGQFSSIKDAVDSISTNSDSNRFMISVMPGIYTEGTIQMKEFVSVEGFGLNSSSVVIQPLSPNQTIMRMFRNSAINNVLFRGASTSGTRAVEMVDGGAEAGFISFCEFIDNAIDVSARGTTTAANLIIRRCEFNITDVTERVVECISTSGNTTRVTITTTAFAGDDPANLQDVFFTSGTGIRLFLDSFFALLLVQSATANGIRCIDGGLIDIGGGIFENFNYNVFLPNTGAGPVFNFNGATARDATTLDVNIENVNASGSLSGNVDTAKMLIAPTANFSILLSSPDPANKGVAIVGPIFIGNDTSTVVDIEDLLLDGLPLGVMEGGVLSDAGGFDVDITAGFGYVKAGDAVGEQMFRVEWLAQTVTLPANESNFVMVNTDGDVFFTATSPGLISAIELGRVITNNVNIKVISQVPNSAHHPISKIDRALRDAFGAVYRTGSLVAENAVTARALDVGSGTYFLSYLRFNPSGGTPITFSQVNHSSGSIVFLDGETQVNNTQYDDGTNLVALSAGFFAKHTLYVSGEAGNEKYFLIISQEEFPDQVTAEAGGIPISPSSFFGSVVLIASIIVQQGNANIVQINDERPTLAFKASSISATSEHGNLFGLADDDHPQYLLTDGSRSLSGNLDLATFDIINVGTVNGVVVEAHGSRHSPNGVDAIATAAPTTALSPTTVNEVGIEDSLARSDHVHEISGFQGVLSFEDDGVSVPGIFTTINFNGGLTLTDAGFGELNVNVPGGVTIQEEGVNLINTPHTTLNFIGNTIASADAGGGVASITVTPVIFRDEGVSITGAPHTDVNFIGGGVSAVNAGGNQVQVLI